MKKFSILFFCLLLGLATPGYAFDFKVPGFGDKTKKDEDDGKVRPVYENTAKDTVNSNSGGGNIINVGTAAGAGSKCDEPFEPPSMAKFSFDISLPWLHMPQYDAKYQFRTESFSIGLSYRLDEFLGGFLEYGQGEDRGISFDNGTEIYKRLDLHTGVLFTFWSRENILEARVGYGMTRMTLQNSNQEINMESSLYFKTTYLWPWNGSSLGVFLQYIESDNGAEKQEEYMKGSTVQIGVVALFGITLAGS